MTPPSPIPASDSRSDRDGAQIWIIGALEMITRGGVGAVKIERLAREIKVSKGSFYWFFRNTDELLARSLEHWKTQLNNNVFEEVRAAQGSVRERMFGMVDRVFRSKLGRYDAAIRAWALYDPGVRAVVADVDRERLSFLGELFLEQGFRTDIALQRAHLFYRAFIAESYLGIYPGTVKKDAYLKALLDDLLTLAPGTTASEGHA